MLLIATGLPCCVHVAINEEALRTLSGFKYTIDIPHVTVNYHILRVAGVHWQKEESNRVALLFNWSSVGLRINSQASIKEDHSSFLSWEAVQEIKPASLCIQRVFFTEWLENTCCIPMGESLYSAEFDMMPCCLLAQVSPCGTTNLMVLCSSRGKVFHKACKYWYLARKSKATYCGHTDWIKNQWSCAITRDYLSQRENMFSLLSKFFQKKPTKPPPNRKQCSYQI